MKNWIKDKLLGGNSNTLDKKRKSRLDQAEEDAVSDKPAKAPAKAYKAGGMVRRGYGKARGC